MIHPKLRCPRHGFNYVSMPRDVEYKLLTPPLYKCPVKGCSNGEMLLLTSIEEHHAPASESEGGAE